MECEIWIKVFVFFFKYCILKKPLLFIYLAASCLNCSTRHLCCGMRDFSLWRERFLQSWRTSLIAPWHGRFQLPDQGWNLGPLHCKVILNQWTTREVPSFIVLTYEQLGISATFIEENFLSLLKCLCTCVRNQLAIYLWVHTFGGFLGNSGIKNHTAMQKVQGTDAGLIPGWGIAPGGWHSILASSILAWRIPRTQEPGVGHD